MIKYLEKSGRTEDEAILSALEELKMDRDDVSVEVLERPKKGFLGIGAKNALVKISYEVPDEPKQKKEFKDKKKEHSKPAADKSQAKPADKGQAKPAADKAQTKPADKQQKGSAPKSKNKPAEQQSTKPAAKKQAENKEPVKSAPAVSADGEQDEKAQVLSFLTGLFDKMNIEAEIEITEKDGNINVNLSGKNVGAIIGRRGETLDAIQHLTNYAVNHGNEKKSHINIDAESYRAKREESLTKLAEKMAEKAIKYKRSMALEPMNSYERHVIHTALQNYEGVTTSSSGEEPNRRVVVSYVKGNNEQSNKPKVKEWA